MTSPLTMATALVLAVGLILVGMTGLSAEMQYSGRPAAMQSREAPIVLPR